jgi:hypothetical protein
MGTPKPAIGSQLRRLVGDGRRRATELQSALSQELERGLAAVGRGIEETTQELGRGLQGTENAARAALSAAAELAAPHRLGHHDLRIEATPFEISELIADRLWTEGNDGGPFTHIDSAARNGFELDPYNWYVRQGPQASPTFQAWIGVQIIPQQLGGRHERFVSRLDITAIGRSIRPTATERALLDGEWAQTLRVRVQTRGYRGRDGLA